MGDEGDLSRVVADDRYSNEFIGALVRRIGLPPERRTEEFGFIYDGSPEWSSHAYVKWSLEAAEHYREDAILWRDPARVGDLIVRERVSYTDSVGDWSRVPATAPSHVPSTSEGEK